MTKRSVQALMGLALLFAFGCSSDDTTSPEPDPGSTTRTGVFLDSPVVGIDFRTATHTGQTSALGEFQYEDGEMVTFSIGSVDLPSVAAQALVTPMTLAGAASITDDQATNIARLLLALDDDQNPDNGLIVVGDPFSSDAVVDFDLTPAAFAAQADLVVALESLTVELPSAAEAQAHVDATIADLALSVAGIWQLAGGTGFGYLVLFEDGRFLYGENDPDATGPEENGVEVGTYTFDPLAGSLEFHVVYDDNAPGQGSGVGDPGTPASFAAQLNPDRTVLGLPDEQIHADRLPTAGNAPVVGVWSATQGTDFNYLVLLDNGVFLYAENDASATGPEENGLEVGTYAVSGSDLIFTLQYDDNAPGEDSGVGDIGTPVTIDFSLQDGNQTLVVAGGQLQLTRDL